MSQIVNETIWVYWFSHKMLEKEKIVRKILVLYLNDMENEMEKILKKLY